MLGLLGGHLAVLLSSHVAISQFLLPSRESASHLETKVEDGTGPDRRNVVSLVKPP